MGICSGSNTTGFPLCSKGSGTPDSPGIGSFRIEGCPISFKGSTGTYGSIGTSGSGGFIGACPSNGTHMFMRLYLSLN